MALSPVVLDTNVLISGLLLPHSLPAQARYWIEDRGLLLASLETIAELEEVLRRPKFDKISSLANREAFVRRFRDAARIVRVFSSIRVCRDPRDDKFLELATDAKADAIVTGDRDLLVLHPFRSVQIVSPRTFLEAVGADPQ